MMHTWCSSPHKPLLTMWYAPTNILLLLFYAAGGSCSSGDCRNAMPVQWRLHTARQQLLKGCL